MKLYIITIDEVNDYVNDNYTPIVRLTKKEALKDFNEFKKQARSDYKESLENEYQEEGYDNKHATHFECYREGYYAQDHFSITIHTVEVQGVMKSNRVI